MLSLQISKHVPASRRTLLPMSHSFSTLLKQKVGATVPRLHTVELELPKLEHFENADSHQNGSDIEQKRIRWLSLFEVLCSHFAWHFYVPPASFGIDYPLYYFDSAQMLALTPMSELESSRRKTLQSSARRKVRTSHWSLTGAEFEATTALVKHLYTQYPVVETMDSIIEETNSNGEKGGDKQKEDSGLWVTFPVRNSGKLRNYRPLDLGIHSCEVLAVANGFDDASNSVQLLESVNLQRKLASVKVVDFAQIKQQLTESPLKHSQFGSDNNADTLDLRLRLRLQMDSVKAMDYLREDVLTGYFLSLYALYTDRAKAGGATQRAILSKVRKQTGFQIGSEWKVRKKMRKHWTLEQVNKFQEKLKQQSPLFKARRILHSIAHVIRPQIPDEPKPEPAENEEMTVSEKSEHFSTMENEVSKLDILSEDCELLVVDKPPGLAVSGSSKSMLSLLMSQRPAVRTLQCSAHEVCHSHMVAPQIKALWVATHPGLVSKNESLERRHSGLMLVAKSAFALNEVHNQLKEYRLQRHFTVLCHGSLPRVDCHSDAFHIQSSKNRGGDSTPLPLAEMGCFDDDIDELLSEMGAAMPYAFYASESSALKFFQSLEGAGDVIADNGNDSLQHLDEEHSDAIDSMSLAEFGLAQIFGKRRTRDDWGNPNGDYFLLQNWIGPRPKEAALAKRSADKSPEFAAVSSNDMVCFNKSAAKHRLRQLVDSENVATGRASTNTQSIAATAWNKLAPSSTLFTRLASFEVANGSANPSQLTLVQCSLHTSRLDQVALHCAELGLSIVGDTRGRGPKDSRTALEKELFGDWLKGAVFCHCSEIEFEAPTDKKRCSVQSPLPQKLAKVLAFCENNLA